jgi:hypothetical protein
MHHCTSILFPLYYSLYLSYLSIVPSERPTNTIMFLSLSLCLSLYIYMCVCVCMHICVCMYLCLQIYLIDLASTYERKHMISVLWTWLTSLNMMVSSSIHLPLNNKISLLVVLGFGQIRAFILLDRHSTTWATPSALFCVGFFQDRIL